MKDNSRKGCTTHSNKPHHHTTRAIMTLGIKNNWSITDRVQVVSDDNCTNNHLQWCKLHKYWSTMSYNTAFSCSQLTDKPSIFYWLHLNHLNCRLTIKYQWNNVVVRVWLHDLSSLESSPCGQSQLIIDDSLPWSP